MHKIYLGSAGGAPTNNVIRSLRQSGREYHLVGASSAVSDLFLADVEETRLIPRSDDPRYRSVLLRVLTETKPDLIHAQHDFEVLAISRLRDDIHELGVKTFLPSAHTVEVCVDKYDTYSCWKRDGVRTPETVLIESRNDVKEAFDRFGPTIWLRARRGAGASGALPTDDYDFACGWIDYYQGWGKFTAAQKLESETVTWQSIWQEGELIVAQTRRRRSWGFADRTLSGVTGVTIVGVTASDPRVDEVAVQAIRSIDATPNGIFGVDMTYDSDGEPNPTEINIGRFFTTIEFFTKAGLNMPDIYCATALGDEVVLPQNRVNPLPVDLVWVRGMDVPPVLTTLEAFESKAREADSF